MRTIKFRGKDSNGNWHYGDLENSPIGKFFRIHEYRDNGFYKWHADVDPATVGQFTGVKDRNGNEVYEGDILVVEGIKYPRYHIVSWDERKFMFCINETPLYAYLHGDTLLREYVVRGNIHDNPELLKGGNNELL